MRNVRIGRPTLTPEGKARALSAIESGRLSEGLYTEELERAAAARLGAAGAVAANSGHSALYLALRAAREVLGKSYAVTTPLTFISTVSAALEAGLDVWMADLGPGAFVIDQDQAEDLLARSPDRAVYLPVHLFGYPAPRIPGYFAVQDACEALGTVSSSGQPVGVPDIGCFSFYTSHVLGCGELGLAVSDDRALLDFMRSVKDQGRRHLRPSDHVDRPISIPWRERFSHDRLGWNLRTTDLQAALALGALPYLDGVIGRRAGNVAFLNRRLAGYSGILTLPPPAKGVSYLAYPLLARDSDLRDRLVAALERLGVESRPLMSFVPEEKAVAGRIAMPFRAERAGDLHRRGFYVSCHDSLLPEDLDWMAEAFDRAIAEALR